MQSIAKVSSEPLRCTHSPGADSDLVKVLSAMGGHVIKALISVHTPGASLGAGALNTGIS